MKKVSREKAALVVFFLLGFSVLAIAIAYICTLGHSLNVAASSIDDAAGSLDGYTALVYEGTAENHRETVVDTTGVKDGKLTPRSLNKESTQKSEEKKDELSASQASDVAKEGEGENSVSLFSLRCSYVEKQASVIVVDVADLGRYNERTVVRADGRTFGFLSIDEVTAQQSYFAKRVADYKKLGVDMVVCVTKDLSLLDNYAGATIVISSQDEGISSHGALVKGVFYDDAAMVGQVGTVLVSPSLNHYGQGRFFAQDAPIPRSCRLTTVGRMKKKEDRAPFCVFCIVSYNCKVICYHSEVVALDGWQTSRTKMRVWRNWQTRQV